MTAIEELIDKHGDDADALVDALASFDYRPVPPREPLEEPWSAAIERDYTGTLIEVAELAASGKIAPRVYERVIERRATGG